MPEYATWNPADKGPNIVLSNNDLSVESTQEPWNAVRATQGKSSGKWYFEVFGVFSSAEVIFGFGTSAMFLGDGSNHGFPGYDPADISWGHHWANENRWNQRTSSAQFTNVGSTVIYRVKADLDTGEIKIAIGGGSFYAASLNATNLAGKTVFPSVGILTIGPTFTVNFGASAFNYAVPDGYNSGWYEEAAGSPAYYYAQLQ